MRILHVMTRFLRGGAEEKTLLEIENLHAVHEFAVATGPEVEQESLARLDRVGVAHHVIPALRHYRPWLAPRAIAQVRQIIRAGRFDAVHTHSTEGGIVGREAARREGVKKLVHTIHGPEFSPAHPWLVRRTVVAFHRRQAPSVARYWSNSESLIQDFLAQRIGVRQQYTVVRSGLDPLPIERADKVPLEGRPAVLTATRLVRGKGLEELVEAVAILAPRWPDLRLSFAGTGPLRPELEALGRRRGVGDRLRFLGFRNDLAGLLKSADVFAFASHREGTPRVVTEAMVAGCPVVATAIDGVPEQVEHGRSGLLVPVRDAAALAEAIEDTLASPERAKDRARAAMEGARRFSLTHMMGTIQTEYEALEVPVH